MGIIFFVNILLLTTLDLVKIYSQLRQYIKRNNMSITKWIFPDDFQDEMKSEIFQQVNYIHYINYLWHLSLENHSLIETSKMLLKRKVSLQSKLIANFFDFIEIKKDDAYINENVGMIIFPEIKDETGKIINACHYKL